jgi:hypothetical protein
MIFKRKTVRLQRMHKKFFKIYALELQIMKFLQEAGKKANLGAVFSPTGIGIVINVQYKMYVLMIGRNGINEQRAKTY